MSHKHTTWLGFFVLSVLFLLAWNSRTLAQKNLTQPDVIQSPVDIQEWAQINPDGFGNPSTIGVTALEVFHDQLYAGTANWEEGGQIWRTSNGISWTPVSELGFTSTLTNTNPVIADLIEFDGQLYASTCWANQGQIWRSPDGTTWEAVVEDGFGNPDSTGISAFTIFSDTLYAGVSNGADGLEIWRSLSGDSLSWTPVITAGFGYTTNMNVTGFIGFKDYLYAAIEPSQDVPITNNFQIWRSHDGEDWEPITTSGFGNPDNHSAGGLAVFQDKLYIGLRNEVTGGQVWRSEYGVGWEGVVPDGFGDIHNIKIESLYVFEDILFAVTYNEQTGMEVWRSLDGWDWDQVNKDGFDDNGNYSTLWNNATTIFQDHLVYGTWNYTTGGEVWLFEPEPRLYLPLVKRD